MQSRPKARIGMVLSAGLWAALPSGTNAQSLDIILNCSGCHALDRTGDASRAPQYPVLNGQPARYLAQQLDAYRTGARQHPQMELTAQALGEGGAAGMARMYAHSFTPDYIFTGDPAQMETAITLNELGDFDRGLPSCQSCHALGDVDGIDRSDRLAPRLHGQPARYLADQLRAYADGSRTTGPMGRMQAFSSQLTDAEIDALAAYFAAFEEEPRE